MSKRLRRGSLISTVQGSWLPGAEATLMLQLGREGAGSLPLLPELSKMGERVHSFHLSIHVCMNPEIRELGRATSSVVEGGRSAHGQRETLRLLVKDSLGRDAVDSLKDWKARAHLYQPMEHMHHQRWV